MTSFDVMAVGILLAVAMLAAREMLCPTNIDNDMKYHLKIRLGSDSFSILSHAPDYKWVRLEGPIFEMCEKDDFIYIEQLNGPTLTTRIEHISFIGDRYYLHCVRI